MYKKILTILVLLINCFCLNGDTFQENSENQLEPIENSKLQIPYPLEQARQIGLPSNPLGFLNRRIPCQCDKGVCKCCTGSTVQAFGLNGCMEIVYIPQDFAFELKMKMNNFVLYRNKVSGKNPPPVCVRPPRIGLIKVCVTFYDIYFIGRNMHVCLDLGGFFQGYELFSRSFDCLRFGAQGFKIVKPEEGYPVRPDDVDIDDDDEEIEDYDENVVRSALKVI